jgi:hypothetical protein
VIHPTGAVAGHAVEALFLVATIQPHKASGTTINIASAAHVQLGVSNCGIACGACTAATGLWNAPELAELAANLRRKGARGRTTLWQRKKILATKTYIAGLFRL